MKLFPQPAEAFIPHQLRNKTGSRGTAFTGDHAGISRKRVPQDPHSFSRHVVGDRDKVVRIVMENVPADYMKENMKSGGNAGMTSTFSAGIMIPVTATITTAGVSSLVTIPISFVVSAAVDKVVAPAFARGDFKKILNEANYYTSLTEFCGSLSYTMEIASAQYVGFVSQMVSQQQRFSALAGNVIFQQAIDDFEYYASLPTEEVGVVDDLDGLYMRDLMRTAPSEEELLMIAGTADL